MASGMGIPSMCIYAYELFNVFDVENIIRIGTAGSLDEKLKLKDVVVGIGASTDSNVVKQFDINGSVSPTCSFELLSAAMNVAKSMNIKLNAGNFYTTDLFYNPDIYVNNKWAERGSIAVEMETAGLYLTAMRCKKRALAICTISDLPLLPDCPGCTVEEREQSFTDMMKVALETAIKI